MDESSQDAPLTFDLSELAGFQFGPNWARERTKASDYSAVPERPVSPRRRERGDAPRRDREPRQDRQDRPRRGAPRQQQRREPVRRELPAPAEGLRVELRPSNNILTVFSTEIQRQKRAHSLLDLARVVMKQKDRYDIVFMKQEGGPSLIHSLKEDGACWLSEAEAMAYLHKAPWFSELYSIEQVEAEAPKGTFTGIAECSLGGELIGPVNWHGYQPAVAALYKSKYSHMDMGAFRAAIRVNKSEEAVQAWLQQASARTVWRPTREGAQDTELTSLRAVEEDFREHHFAEVYETVDKVFVNGSTPFDRLSSGLAAHVSILSGRHRHTPQILIPNLCHGLARHRMPIFRWHTRHYTGPSRIRTVPEDLVLADRMVAILEWSKQNSGKKVEAMYAELSGVPAGSDDEGKKAAAEAYDPYTADMIWLIDQGFILVTNDNSIWYPKGEAAPKA